MLNLHLLECTLKGYDHISDLLLAKYWVITGCKYIDCVNLKSLTLGENIGIIRLFAFDECRVLEEITCYAKKPPLSDGMILLSKNRAKCKLRVPKGSLLTYKTAPVWKLFKKIEGF